MMKTCFKCLGVKPLSEFYAHKEMADGHLNKCKECTKADTQKTRSERVDYYREYDRRRGRTEQRKSLNRERGRRVYRERQDGARAKAKAMQAKEPEKYRARYLMSNAIRDGRLVRRPCEECGDPNSHGHHHDYSKPLEVQWLCRKHHGEQHRMYP